MPKKERLLDVFDLRKRTGVICGHVHAKMSKKEKLLDVFDLESTEVYVWAC